MLSTSNTRPKNNPLVNDIHSQLNATRVHRISRPKKLAELIDLVSTANKEGKSIAIAGGRHAMGGQQFASDAILLDMSNLNRVIKLDSTKGLIEVEAGIEWPQLINWLLENQKDSIHKWGIIQKQTGADRLSLGGALAANIHGRGLQLKPIIQDVASFTLINSQGEILNCSRNTNTELFALAIGGYGLFGIIATVTLKLMLRQKVRRDVSLIAANELMPAFADRIQNGYLYGDFQFSTDANSDTFLNNGVFSCYRPVDNNTPIDKSQQSLSPEKWQQLIYLAHTDRAKTYQEYTQYYLSTSGQTYWSDTHQLSTYVDHYHDTLDQQLNSEKSSEMITELYVPKERLTLLLNNIKEYLIKTNEELIYGTIRLIEEDNETFLAWAKQPYACIIFNLHVTHNQEKLNKAKRSFRHLIDCALQQDGSYFLTYHKWANRLQVEIAYPQFAEFLKLKRKFDPKECFQSDWYRHYKKMFSDVL